MKNSKLIASVVLGASMLWGTSAFAFADAKPYLGVGFGYTRADIAKSKFSPEATSVKQSSYGWQGFGGFQFTQYVAGEIGFADFGEVKAKISGANKKVSTRAATFSVVGFAPMTKEFSLIGKLGYARARVKMPGGSYWNKGGASNRTVNAAILGVGGQYNINDTMAVRLSWDRLFSKRTTNGYRLNNNLLAANFIYSFEGM